MASSHLRFGSFPPEIIQRIASFSPCESVLALLKVNRHFYKTCNDNAVFKSILRNGNGYGLSKRWDCEMISKGTSTSTLARLALADSRARAWLAGIERHQENEHPQQMSMDEAERSEDDKTPNPILQWAPQLVALHHPFIMELDVRNIVSQFRASPMKYHYDINNDVNGVMAISFCVAATVLYHGSEALKAGPSIAHLPVGQIHEILASKDFCLIPHIPVNLICSLISNGRRVVREIPPPSPFNIPFGQLSDIPLPFSHTPLRQTVPVTTSISFLEHGEWVGYYSYQLNLEIARWDPPMKGIHFTADAEAGPFAVRASGVDSVGKFTLAGNVSRNGLVEMRKTYAQGFFWDWSAIMTPFGIVGTWGRGQPEHRRSGHLWLWKREWSQV